MSLKHGILGLLTFEDMSGYDINKYFDQSLQFFWNAHQSQIYRELDKLKENGFVSSSVIHQDNRPDKKLFSITDEGRKELVEWINEYFVEEEIKVRDPFLMRIFFSYLGEEEKLQESLKEYIEHNKFYLESLEEIEDNFVQDKSLSADNPQIYWLMTIKKGYHNFRANIAWAEEALEMLESM